MSFFRSVPSEAGPPHLYAKYAEIYRPWAHMSQAVMNGPSPLSQGERELIFAYAAGVAGCQFVCVAHSEVAYAWGIERGLVERLLEAPETAAVEPRLATLLAFARKLTLAPSAMSQADADAVVAAGWDERAVHDAVAVTGRAAFMTRLVSAYGFTPMARDVAARRATKRVEQGYVDLFPAFRGGK